MEMREGSDAKCLKYWRARSEGERVAIIGYSGGVVRMFSR